MMGVLAQVLAKMLVVDWFPLIIVGPVGVRPLPLMVLIHLRLPT
jgi:hypothetical protein